MISFVPGWPKHRARHTILRSKLLRQIAKEVADMSSRKKKILPRCIEYGPPEHSPEKQKELEKGFILDGIAVGTFSGNMPHASPKLATAIPPYNARKDVHSQQYFEGREVTKTLKKTGQVANKSLCKSLSNFYIISLTSDTK